MKKYPRLDANHNQVVGELRKEGCRVQSLASIGGGCPDILVGYRGKNFLFEIKTLTGKLTDDESVWSSDWNGQYDVIYDSKSAMRIMRRAK